MSGNFFHLCLALTENVIKTPVYHRNLSFQLARTSLCQEFSLKPVWASSMTTSLIKNKQLSDWCMPKLQRLFMCTGGPKRRYSHSPWLRAGRIPLHHTHCQELNNSKDVPLPLYQCTVHNREFLLVEGLNLYLILLNAILPLSPPSISLIWFWTTIIGNISLIAKYDNSISDDITHRIR